MSQERRESEALEALQRIKEVTETIDTGWNLLRKIPRAELKRIRPEYLEKYYQQKK